MGRVKDEEIFFSFPITVSISITRRRRVPPSPDLLYLKILLNTKFSRDFFLHLVDLFAIINQTESLGPRMSIFKGLHQSGSRTGASFRPISHCRAPGWDAGAVGGVPLETESGWAQGVCLIESGMPCCSG